MQFTCNVHETAETITATMMDEIFTVTAEDTCGAADQSEDTTTEMITKPDTMTAEEYRKVRREYARLHPPKPPTEAEKRKRAEYQRRYRARHPERVRQWQREWRQRNPDRVQQHQRTFWMKKAAELRQQSELEKELQCSNMRDNCDECPRATTCEAEYDAMLEAVNLAELRQQSDTDDTTAEV